MNIEWLLLIVFVFILQEYVAASTFLSFATKNVCTEPGLTCKDCNKIVNCVPKPDGSVDEDGKPPLQCPNGFKCYKASCVVGSCNSAAFKFECQQNGIFPHPLSCDSYFMCMEDTSTNTFKLLTKTCTDGYFYDPKTMLCSRNIAFDDTCEPMVKGPCTNDVDFGAIAQHTKLFYQCVKVDDVSDPANPKSDFKMTMNYCPGDKIFLNNRCWDSKLSDLNNNNGTCKTTGKHYNPDCKKYNDCSTVGRVPAVRTCPTGQYFNFNKTECVGFKC